MGDRRSALLRSVVVTAATGVAAVGLSLPAAAAPVPDPGFGTAGVVSDGAHGAFLDAVGFADGGVAAVSADGIAWDTNAPVPGVGVVHRYDIHGVPVPTFGVDGQARLAVAGYQLQFGELQHGPSGTLVAIGRYARTGAECGIAVARLSASTGDPDLSFGTGGFAFVASGAHLACPWFTSYEYTEGSGTVLPDGRVVVVDQYYSRTLAGRPDLSGGSAVRPFVAVLTAGGSPSTAFGTNGHVVLGYPFREQLGRLHVGADGSLLLGVSTSLRSRTGVVGALGVWRLRPNGTPDPAFGQGGLALRRPFGRAVAEGLVDVVPQSGRRVVVAGALDPIVDMYWRQSITAVVRLSSSGAGDPSFAGGMGYARLPSLFVTRAERESDGSIVVAGAEADGDWDSETPNRYVGRASHLSANGALDYTWGNRGVRSILVPGNWQGMHLGLAAAPSGRLVLAGQWTPSHNWGDPPVPAASMFAVQATRPPRVRGWLESRLSGAYGGWRSCGATLAAPCALGSTWNLTGGGWPFEARDPARVLVQVQRRGADGVWRSYATTTSWVTDDGAFRSAGRLTSVGLYRFRAAVPASATTLLTYSPWTYGRRS